MFKDQLQTAIDLLLQLTARKVSPNAETIHPPTSATSTQEDCNYIVHRIFGTNPDFDKFHDEGEYKDIQDYSQSNLVMPNSVQCLFSIGEERKVEDQKIVEEEEMKEQTEEVKGIEKVNYQPLLLSALLFSFLFSTSCY